MKRLFEFFWYEGKFYPIRKRSGPIGNPTGINAHFQCFGVLLNPKACWIGAHYGGKDKRLCINLIPFVTLWWAKPGGTLP